MSVERFWTEGNERHREIAETFYRGLETYSPEVATGGKNDCLICPTACTWHATRITYTRYNGPDVKNI